MQHMLDWVASSGEMKLGRANNAVWGVISGKTAGALEMQGLVERRYTGQHSDNCVYITEKGRALAQSIDDGEDEDAESAEPAELQPIPDLELAAARYREARIERDEAIRIAHSSGLAIRAISRKVGLSHPGVIKILERAR